MCGICGILRLDSKMPELGDIKLMQERLRHRGPDGEGSFAEGSVALGHLRLSILDLSHAADQPMISADGRYAIVYNGEVYNYVEIRNDLKTRGYEFRTSSDTEVILAAYAEWGMNCLERFNGMWAFAIWDRHEKMLFAARDRFGVKPFYYHLDARRLVFASEIKALVALDDVPREPNELAIYEYLLFNGTDHGADTFFAGIRQLPPGHRLVAREGRVETEPWWTLSPEPNDGDAAVYRGLLKDAVRLRLRSDVPVGSCLSGGLDSSAIVGLMRECLGPEGDIRTYTAVYPGRSIDESRFAELAASTFSTRSTTVQPNETGLMTEVERLVYHQDEPFLSTSMYGQWEVMRGAAQTGIKVLLDGQGADEVLGGYHYFFGYRIAELARRGRLVRAWRELRAYRRIHGSSYGLRSALFASLPANLQERLNWPRGDLDPQFLRRGDSESVYVRSIVHAKSLDEALLVNTTRRLPQLLRVEDRNSMAFGIEARLPFLDYRVARLGLGAPPERKVSAGWTKVILREAMRGLLPEPIRGRRDKIGFATDEDRWFREPDVAAWARSILESDSFAQRRILDLPTVRRVFDAHLEGRVNAGARIWKWINLELWFRRFIDPSRVSPYGTKDGTSAVS